MFPSLVNCTTIDYFSNWPEEALLSLADGEVSEEYNLGEQRDGVIKTFPKLHKTVELTSDEFRLELKRTNYVTPASYIELLNLQRAILFSKREELSLKSKRLEGGVQKIKDSEVTVGALQIDIAEMIPRVEKQTKEIEIMSADVEKQSQETNVIAVRVGSEEAEAMKIAAEAKGISDNCAKLLGEAEPALLVAKKAVEGIKKDDVVNCKTILGKAPVVLS